MTNIAGNEVMEYRTLGRTGLKVSLLGFGASPLGDVFRKTDPAESQRAVHLAIDHGINYFDTSPYYGRTLSEQRLGQALAGKRHQIILATKCGRIDADVFDFSPKAITASVDESLRRLQTDYVDLLQAHDVEFGGVQQIIDETIPAMRRLQQQGKARFIGITGYPLKTLLRIAEKVPVDTILSYCHYNPMITDMDDVLTPFARREKIGLINASPLHMGLLSERAAPDWHPAPPELRAAAKNAVEICRRGVDIASVALRFCLDHDYVSTTLVGMSRLKDVEANVAVVRARSDPALIQEIRAAIGPAFNCVWPSGRIENQN